VISYQLSDKSYQLYPSTPNTKKSPVKNISFFWFLDPQLVRNKIGATTSSGRILPLGKAPVSSLAKIRKLAACNKRVGVGIGILQPKGPKEENTQKKKQFSSQKVSFVSWYL
jgi:hypothetical protein